MRVTAVVERFAVAGHFTIARGAKRHVDVVSCEVSADGLTGRGEGTPIYYRGETAQGCVAAFADYGLSDSMKSQFAVARPAFAVGGSASSM